MPTIVKKYTVTTLLLGSAALGVYAVFFGGPAAALATVMAVGGILFLVS